ncbi:hypothetical protein BH24DEI1_BH24DEI1_01370 [soil metagenome]
MQDPHDLLQTFHGMIARATEGVWHRDAAEAAITLEQAHEVLEALRPQLEDALYERLLNTWINAAQLVEHAGDYGPDQERPR